MANPRKKPPEKPPAQAVGKKPNRTGKPIHVWVDEAVVDAIDGFRASQRLKPSLKDVVELALQEFLSREGHWPSKSK